jgi:flavin-dependent dehydrogenase
VERVDVLIAGGGPAGSSLALGLRGSGLCVRILDRAVFPRDKTCAGWVTPAVWRALDLSPSDYGATGRTLQPIRGFQVARMGAPPSRALHDGVVSHGIRRCEFDAFLLARCGAEVRAGEAVRAVERVGGGWLVNGDTHARLLVGAGGHFCPVARALTGGAKEAPVVAQEFEIEADGAAVDPEVPEIWYTRDLAGYAWVFRKGRYLNVGLGRRGGALSEELQAFVAPLAAGGRVPASWKAAVRGHAYLTYPQTRRPLVAPAAALIGDAAGLAYPKSGEGIRPAVESGLLLARALRGRSDPASRAALDDYQAAMHDRFGPRLGAPAEPVPAWQAALAGKLFSNPAFARRVVVDRWFLNAGQAPLSPPPASAAGGRESLSACA